MIRLCIARFDSADDDIWGTFTQRDEPIYEEEVVEIFIAPGADDPVRYFEFQVSPNGVLFDARIYNPTSTRQDLELDKEWNCPDIRWVAQRDDAAHSWWAALALPWNALTSNSRVPQVCHANFYRIERPHNGEPEYRLLVAHPHESCGFSQARALWDIRI